MYTMLTRERCENHIHLITDKHAQQQDRANEHQLALPGLDEQLSATEMLERVLARDGSEVSATSTRHESATPQSRLHDAAVRYADAVAYASHKLLGASDDERAGAGPLPWLPSIPVEVTAHPSWGPYLTARAHLLSTLAGQVRERAETTLPSWFDPYDDVLTPGLRAELAVWRAANCVAPDERTMTGPPPDDDGAAAYRRRLPREINSRYGDAVHVWEARVVAYVGRSDEHTLDVARELDRLRRQGHDPGRLLRRAMTGPLPQEHPTSALAHRIRRLSPRIPAAAQRGWQPVMTDAPSRPPAHDPGLGL